MIFNVYSCGMGGGGGIIGGGGGGGLLFSRIYT